MVDESCVDVRLSESGAVLQSLRVHADVLQCEVLRSSVRQGQGLDHGLQAQKSSFD